MEDKKKSPETRLTIGSREEIINIYSAGGTIHMDDFRVDIESIYITNINSPEIMLNASETYGAYYTKGKNAPSEIATKSDLSRITNFMDKLLLKLNKVTNEDFKEELEELKKLRDNFSEEKK